MTSNNLVRATALTGIAGVFLGGSVSAYRHEEIFLICAIAGCKAAAHVVQLLGLASWGLGVLLVGVFLLVAVFGLAGTILASGAILLIPNNRVLLWIGSLLYAILAIFLLLSLLVIFTNPYWGSLFKNADGPPLSHWYTILPVLFVGCSLGFFHLSKFVIEEPWNIPPAHPENI